MRVRVSRLDASVLAVAALLAIASAGVVPELSVFVVWVTAHFFVFCNVVRLPRALELAWAAVLVGAVVGCALLALPLVVALVPSALASALALRHHSASARSPDASRSPLSQPDETVQPRRR